MKLRPKTALFGGALVVVVAASAIGGAIYQATRVNRLNSFWDQVVCKLEVILGSYRTKLTDAAREGVDDSTAYQIMTDHTEYNVLQENLRCHLYVVPQTDNAGVLAVHIEASPELVAAMQDFLLDGTSSLPTINAEIQEGGIGDTLVVRMTATWDINATLVTEKIHRAITYKDTATQEH